MSAPSSVIFVGNIPFDLTEEQIKDILGDVGPIIDFKLVFDRETGKPKGYGFCEYPDIETANSAIRNYKSSFVSSFHSLRDMEINGRKIRLDYADPNSLKRGGGGSGGDGQNRNAGGGGRYNQQSLQYGKQSQGRIPMQGQGQGQGQGQFQQSRNFPPHQQQMGGYQSSQNAAANSPNVAMGMGPGMNMNMNPEMGMGMGMNMNMNVGSGISMNTGPGPANDSNLNQNQSTTQSQDTGTGSGSGGEGKPTTQMVAEIIASLSEQQKKDLLGQIKESALKDNVKTRQILNQSPQLAYALFHTMVELKLLDGPSIQRILMPSLSAPALASAQQQQQQQLGYMIGQRFDSPQTQAQTPSQIQTQIKMQTPPVASNNITGVSGPNNQNIPQQAQGLSAEQSRQLASQVMSLTQEQIQQLPIEQQRQLLALQAQFSASQGGQRF